MLIYLNKITAADQLAFSKKVAAISQDLQINANWLMQVMYSESRLNPAAVNANTGATGLIQFMPKTAELLGTTTDALRNMSVTDQLTYVRKYYLPYVGMMKSYFDVYLATFFPAGIGKPDNWIFQSSNLAASTIAAQNPAINIDGDNKITIAEFKQYLLRTVPEDFRRIVFGTGGTGLVILALLAGGVVAWYNR